MDKDLIALKAILPQITGRDLSFADDLVRKGEKYGLSEKQRYWVVTLTKRWTTGEDDRPTVELPSFDGVIALIDRALRKLKFPKIWLQFEDGTPLRLQRAGERSKYTGQLFLTDGQPFGYNLYFGRISQEGDLTLSAKGEARKDELVSILTALATAPAEVATHYGKLTGHCIFCHQAIGEGDDPRSVEVGYGPVCAKNYGLPWGSKVTENDAVAALAAREAS